MKLRARLLTLLAVSLGSFFGALLILHQVQEQSVKGMVKSLEEEKQVLLQRVVALQGATLRQFARDYTQWDEMCNFVEQPTDDWARVNLLASLENWRFQACWVFRPDGSVVNATLRPDAADLALPMTGSQLAAALAKNPFRQFFATRAGGAVEFQTAPIQPSEDAERKSPPRGWFVVAKVWDAAQLQAISDLTGGSLSWADEAVPTPTRSRTSIHVWQHLTGWEGGPARTLALHAEPPLSEQVQDTDEEEWLLFIVCGLVALLGLAWSLRRWILTPLEQVSAALAMDELEPVRPLLGKGDEFAHVAELFARSMRRKSELQTEIEERRRAERSLRAALEDRAQLGRDLHDQTIQSIYAAGLNLEGILPLVRKDPVLAERRLHDCVNALNEIIAELRGVIAGSEGNAAEPVALKRGLQKIAGNLDGTRPIRCHVEVHEATAQLLQPDECAEFLLIAREAVSNAVRHSECTTITLRFTHEEGDRVLEILDDGRGFEVESRLARGHGLDNMTRRAEEIGAALEVVSRPGSGTKIRVELPDRPNSLG